MIPDEEIEALRDLISPVVLPDAALLWWTRDSAKRLLAERELLVAEHAAMLPLFHGDISRDAMNPLFHAWQRAQDFK